MSVLVLHSSWSHHHKLLPDHEFGLDFTHLRAMQHINEFQLLWSQLFTGSVQRALGPLSQGPSEWRTWRFH